MGKLYDEKSIESYNPREFMRLKPGVYAGDTAYSTQLLVEIISNSVDEYTADNRVGTERLGNKIKIKIDKDIFSVEDNGQGFIPNSFRSDGKTILEASYSVLNTSAKIKEDGSYEGTSLGSFGIGTKLMNFLSHWAIVTTYRDGAQEKVTFKEGLFEKRENSKVPKDKHGVSVQWQPSEEFFTNTEVEITKIRSFLKTVSCLCQGLEIILDYNGKEEIFSSENGLDDLIDDAVGKTEIIPSRFNADIERGKSKIKIGFTYTDSYSSTIVPYVNTGLTERGPHITTIKTLLTREFNKFFREKKWLKEKEDNLSGEDIQEGMYLVFNITSPGVCYDAQVKTSVTKIDTTPFTAILSNEIQKWLTLNEKDIKSIADKALLARRAKEAAKKARDLAREGGEKKKKKVVKMPTKLVDANSKDREKCELYITEGDSATGGLKMGRNENFQAVLPIRGKILNCEKATIEQIQKNAEIMSMIDAFGLKIDTSTMKITYKKKDLRYGKIIIMSDADVDGAHIKNLFYTFIWRFCPQLIADGYIYAGIPPLYKITEKSGKSYSYLKNDAELEEYRKTHSKGSYEVGRMKGLGEMDDEEVAATLMDPTNRIIKQISIGSESTANQLVSQLMGDGGISFRKDFLKKYSEEATYNGE